MILTPPPGLDSTSKYFLLITKWVFPEASITMLSAGVGEIRLNGVLYGPRA